MKELAFAAVLGLALTAQSTTVQASEVLFEQPYTSDFGYTVSSTLNNFGSTPSFRTADNFSLGTAASVTRIEWWSVLPLGAEDFTFTVYDDAAGKPGAVLQAVGGTVSRTALTGDTLYLYAALLDASFDAEAGTIYWLSIFNQAPDGLFRWAGVPGGNNAVAGEIPGPPWNNTRPDAAFRVIGDPSRTVPEPSALLLAALGLTGLWRVSRAQRRA